MAHNYTVVLLHDEELKLDGVAELGLSNNGDLLIAGEGGLITSMVASGYWVGVQLEEPDANKEEGNEEEKTGDENTDGSG